MAGMDGGATPRQAAADARLLVEADGAASGRGASAAPVSAHQVIAGLIGQWDLDLVQAPRDHPLLRGARAAWREDYGLIVVDDALSPAEQAFAVAHELGHRACHPGGCACTDDEMDGAALPPSLTTGEGRVWGYSARAAREADANIFAVELLAPAALLRHFISDGLGYRAIARRLGLTEAATLNALLSTLHAENGVEHDGGEDAAQRATTVDVGTRSRQGGNDGGAGDSLATSGVPSGDNGDNGDKGDKTRPQGDMAGDISAQGDNKRERNTHARVEPSPLSPPALPSPPSLLSSTSLIDTLDDSQRTAADTRAHRALVDAGPGTGKTRTLVARVAGLLARGDAPESILALTFSNRAADEMRARIATLGPHASGVLVVTFHGLALDLLRRFAPQAGLPDDARVLDDGEATLLLEAAMPALALTHYTKATRPGLYLPSLLSAASRLADDLLAVDDVDDQEQANTTNPSVTDAKVRETLALLRAYEGLLDARGLLDYGRLLARAVRLLETHTAVATSARAGLRHVLVDEYQDVNHACARMARALVAGGADLWVVGDARQGIYRFRGAAPDNVTAFEQAYPDAVRLSLGVNYRARPELVDLIAAASRAIVGIDADWTANRDRGTADQDRAGETPGGELVAVASIAVAPTERDECAGIVADVQRSLASGRRPEDHAVLCRTHRHAQDIARNFAEAGLATSYPGAFFLRPEIKDLLCLLSVCGGNTATSALTRVLSWPEYLIDPARALALAHRLAESGLTPARALGDPSVIADLDDGERARVALLSAHIGRAARYTDPAAFLLRFLFDRAPYLARVRGTGTPMDRQRIAAIGHLILLARAFTARPDRVATGDPRAAFTAEVRRLLVAGEVGGAPAALAVSGAINVLTIHASKGLEFPVVYVPNLAAGRFPARKRGGAMVTLPPRLAALQAPDDADERNLFFVACSRARDRLVLSRAERYNDHLTAASPFLSALESAHAVPCVHWAGIASPAPSRAGGGHTVPEENAGIVGSIPLTVIDDRAIEGMVRCPAQHHLRATAGMGDDDRGDYGRYAQIVRQTIARLRADRDTDAWPAIWDEVSTRLRATWDERWEADAPLSTWYYGLAEGAVRRAYEALAGDPAATVARYGARHEIPIDGRSVRVAIDAMEQQAGGETALICERATRRESDASSLRIGLYGAVAAHLSPAQPLPVLIRYLDTGESERVGDPTKALGRHKASIVRAIDRLEVGDFTPHPHDAETCARCPFVLSCPASRA